MPVIVGVQRLFGLLQRVATLVLLSHSVHNEHDEQNSGENTNDRAAHDTGQNARLRNDIEQLGATRLIRDHVLQIVVIIIEQRRNQLRFVILLSSFVYFMFVSFM